MLNNQNEQIEIEERIIQEIKNTKNLIIELKELTSPISPDCAIGRISRMDAINNKTINEAALRKAENKLKGLKLAHQNMNDADFGKCARCNNEIPLGRILLMPHSRFCVHCAS
ncbi:MAG: TraR/DksA C4-type zinc finger protein [Flavobacteriaceae bacterium]|nr:TraR/DksA C4-type zinc finger protein [Flavobacteriaceae bacterium]